MKVKFLSTTNNFAEQIVGQEVELSFSMVGYFEFDPEGLDFDLRKGTWRTSQITSIVYNETSRFCYEIVVSTRNSTYVFQKGTPTEEKPLTDDELLHLGMAMMF